MLSKIYWLVILVASFAFCVCNATKAENLTDTEDHKEKRVIGALPSLYILPDGIDGFLNYSKCNLNASDPGNEFQTVQIPYDKQAHIWGCLSHMVIQCDCYHHCEFYIPNDSRLKIGKQYTDDKHSWKVEDSIYFDERYRMCDAWNQKEYIKTKVKLACPNHRLKVVNVIVEKN